MMRPSREFPALGGLSDGDRSMESLIDAAQLAERQGRRDEARALYEEALHTLGSTAEGPTAAALVRWIGLTHRLDANIDAAFDCFEAALAIAAACGDEGGVGHAINAQAITHFQLGDLEAAEALHRQARESARRAGEVKLAAMTSQNLGVIANIRGEPEMALEYYEASLAEYRALGLPKYMCTVLNNLGMTYTRMGRWETAERAYDEAVQIAQVLGDLPTRVTLEVNRAALWIARSEFPRARDACDLAMSLSDALPDQHALGEAHKCYGIIARETGDYTEAEAAFARAAESADARQDVLLAGEVAREMAEMFRQQGRNRDTLQALNRAHRLFSQVHARPDVADINRQTGELESDFLEIVQRWGDSIESKDQYTQGHCERVADLACAVAEEAGLDEAALFWFRIGALLHDVGKLTIPAEILNKPGRLTADEWTLVKQHPSAGVQMLAGIDFPWDVRPIVESHHERWDGGGYPHGLVGDAIPFTARVLCLADVYDALTSERSYKRGVPHVQAMDVMRSEVGGQFDPELFAHFEAVMTRLHPEGSQPVDRVEIPAPSWTFDRAGTQPAGAPAPADLDHLTGVLLRRAFLEQGNAMLARRRPNEAPPSLLVIDIDHFKLVNDTYGHLQGDDLLRMVVGVFKRTLRTGDVIGRYGGDEFVVLLPRTAPENAVEVAGRIRAAVEAERTPLRDNPGATIGVTLSIGVAAAQPGDHLEALFAASDRALYDAKRAGRNSVGYTQSGEAARPQLTLNRFIGRTSELQRLVRMLETSFEGATQVIAIAGEAGVGKSTLLRQLLPEVRMRSGQLVLGRAVEADVKPPYGPWAEILSAVRSRVDAKGRQWRELSRLLPSLGGAVPDAAAEGSGSKYVLYDEIADFIRLAAEACPLVIVLDDMQWADSASWDTLEHLLTRLEHDRVMIALTLRAEDVTTDVTARRRRLSRDERFQEIVLQRLTREEVEQWLAAASQGQELGQKLLPALYRHTEGNPFLVLQVLRSLIEDGEILFADGRWTWRETSDLRLPVAVSDLMARRLERLAPRTRQILTTAAVIGRVFDIDLAIAAGAGTEDELLDAIDEAVGAAVLEPSRQDSDRYTFAHTLLVDSIRATANPRRLRKTHQAVAEAIEARTPSHAAEIAVHYDQAGDRTRAFGWAMRAGRQAMAVYAHDEAVAFFTMAHRHADTPADRVESALLMAQVAETAGRYAEGERLCNQTLADVAESEEVGGLLRRLRRHRERMRALQGQSSRQTLEAYRRLLAEAEVAGDEAERIELLMTVSEAQGRLGEWQDTERVARDAVRRAERHGDPRLLADALVRLGGALVLVGNHEALQFYERASLLYKEAEDWYGIVRCQINMGIVYSLAGDMLAAEAAYQRAVELGREAHAPDVGGVASLNLGVLYMKAGRYDEAQQYFEEARRLFTQVNNEPHRLATLYNMGHLARERGEPARAVDLYQETAQLARQLAQANVEIGAIAGAGLAAWAIGDYESANASLNDVEALIRGRRDWWFQGRELVEALRVRALHLRAGAHIAAEALAGGVAAAEAHDAYGAAWLVAELAGELAEAGAGSVWTLVERYAGRVDALGYEPLSRRYAALNSAQRLAGAG